MDTRKEYEELSKRPVPDETMPSRDSAGVPSSDENPKHREDFTSLSDAAVRKRESKD
jgi:hypothetical protein